MTKQRETTYRITAEQAGLTVEDYLKNIAAVSARQRQLLTRLRGIRLNSKPAFLKRVLKENDVLSIKNIADKDYGVKAQAGKINILYEDEDLIVLNKPPFMLVHPTGRTETGTLANFLAAYFQQHNKIITIRPVHRLDRDTSGCVIFAKSGRAQKILEDELIKRKLHRTYIAVTLKNPPSAFGTINLPIAVNPKKRNQRIVSEKGDTAVTHYRLLKQSPHASLLELKLDTGRTHQIRVHLAHMGMAIIGDKMYGSPSAKIARQALHAAAVQFYHPVSGKLISINAPLPADMDELLENLALK
jgi:23S rRNA pseudouridine1911/1915/1917 synthase